MAGVRPGRVPVQMDSTPADPSRIEPIRTVRPGPSRARFGPAGRRPESASPMARLQAAKPGEPVASPSRARTRSGRSPFIDPLCGRWCLSPRPCGQQRLGLWRRALSESPLRVTVRPAAAASLADSWQPWADCHGITTIWAQPQIVDRCSYTRTPMPAKPAGQAGQAGRPSRPGRPAKPDQRARSHIGAAGLVTGLTRPKCRHCGPRSGHRRQDAQRTAPRLGT
jgi:hypothetical protein